MAQLNSSRRRRAFIWLPVAATLAAACGGGGDATVGVKNLDADIAFGIDPPESGKTEAADVIAPPPDVDFDPGDEVALVPTRSRRNVVPKVTAASDCPVARANSSAKLASGQEVKEPPTEGSYRWKKGGVFRRQATGSQPVPINGFEQRVVYDVTEGGRGVNPANGLQNMTFSYKTIAPYDSDSTVVNWYTVKTNVEGQEEINVQTGERARSGPPDRGLVLTRVQIMDTRGEIESDKTYDPGLLLLPLPVSPGERFVSTAVEPPALGNPGGQLTFDAQVLPRRRIDACGDLVEGWEVSGRLTEGSDSEAFIERRLFVATQYGATIIYERNAYDSAEGRQAPEFQLAQLSPGPVPEGLS